MKLDLKITVTCDFAKIILAVSALIIAANEAGIL